MGIHFLSKGPIDQISGGYLYTRYLVQHLRAKHLDVTYHPDASALAHVRSQDILIVDSLTLADSPRRLLGTPADLVLLLHVVPEAESLGEDGEETLAALYRRSRVVVTGDSTLTLLRNDLELRGIDAVKIEPGVPGHWRAKEHYASRARALLGVANYLPGKGIARLIDALAAVRNLPWQLTVRGNNQFAPDFYREMLRKVEELRLTERISLLGPVPHDTVNEQMIHADLLVHLSDHETYSMVTAEAIASGLPVLSYRTGNAEDFGKSGLVQHVDECAEQHALRGLIGEAEDYGRLRRVGPRQVRTWRDVGTQFMEWLAL